jgi:hypothetical protein
MSGNLITVWSHRNGVPVLEAHIRAFEIDEELMWG